MGLLTGPVFPLGRSPAIPCPGARGGTLVATFRVAAVFRRHVYVGLHQELGEQDGLLGTAQRYNLLSFGVGWAVFVDVNVCSAYSPMGRIRFLSFIQGREESFFIP